MLSASLKGYMTQLRATEQVLKGKVTQTYRELVAEIFVDIVTHTPQFSGNLASSWEIVFGPYGADGPTLHSQTARNSILRKAYAGEFDPYKRGDDPAVQIALSRELPKLDALRYNSVVRIVNMANYAEAVDAGKGPGDHDIRPENLYYGKVFMTSYAAVKYSRLKNLVKVLKK